ncbi:hypothetical protein [Streptomyces sp. DfronAA-171]|uniref:hypothetical protein n=1 Tax=Streptomyces sp. DfronAA-171 TaxID=1839777 RepID=UPI00081D4CBD|nr:hypothetical protein [Streptomyces sp. DfronAA-171]SCE50163.1 hypothetical protein GA0115252_15492 [Streptomyces sp. DfronAA-171]
MDAGRRSQAPASAVGSGGSWPSSGSSRTCEGSPESLSTVTSRTGAIARATSSHHAESTRSARTSSTFGTPELRTDTRLPSATTTAVHSSGSSRSRSSTHSPKTRTPGPCVSTWTIPGTSRSRRAPSRTTRMSGSRSNVCARAEEDLAATRFWMSEISSLTRCAVLSGSLPIATGDPGRPEARCGSQRTQFHDSACSSVVRTTIRRSRGLCRTAACATAQHARSRGARPGPETPTTPWSVISRPYGTSASRQCTARWFVSRAWSSIRLSEGRVTVPSRSVRKSGSRRRRCHSSVPGPLAWSSTVAGSGKVSLRSSRSSTVASRTSRSSAARRSR